MGKKNTKHIRIPNELIPEWKDACKGTGLDSPKLFKKIWNSPKIKVKDRIAEEIEKTLMKNKIIKEKKF